MADRPISVPAVDKLERPELLALVKIVSAGRIWDLDVATARWEAACLRYEQAETTLNEALCEYTDAKTRWETAAATGRPTKAASRALDVARSAYVRAAEKAADAFTRSSRRYTELRRIKDEGTSR